MIPAGKFLSLPPDQITPTAEEEFFSSLRLRNGTYKTTYRKRFTKIDGELRKLLEHQGIRLDNILDIGVSSGCSTLELYEEATSTGHKARVVGTDLMVNAYLVRVFPRCFALVDDTGYPLRYDIFSWSMKPWVISKDYWNGFFIVRKCVNLAFGRRARKMISRPDSAGIEAVVLVTPKLLGHAGITVQKDDIARYNHTFEGKFSFIRAANILNKGYFSHVELLSAVGNVVQYLEKPKAALLVIRTHQDGVNHGSLFLVEGPGKCEVLRRFGQGSEIEDVVLECVQGCSVKPRSEPRADLSR